jgi:hypothetical protein
MQTKLIPITDPDGKVENVHIQFPDDIDLNDLAAVEAYLDWADKNLTRDVRVRLSDGLEYVLNREQQAELVRRNPKNSAQAFQMVQQMGVKPARSQTARINQESGPATDRIQ